MNDVETAYAPPQEVTPRSTLLLWLLVIGMGILLAAMAAAIFFLLLWIRYLQTQRIVAVELGEVVDATPLTVEPAEMQVDITKDGEYIVNDQIIDEAGLIALLQRLAINNPGVQTVHIRAHRDVPFRYALTVIGICKMENLTYYCTVLEEERIDEPPPGP